MCAFVHFLTQNKFAAEGNTIIVFRSAANLFCRQEQLLFMSVTSIESGKGFVYHFKSACNGSFYPLAWEKFL